MSPVYLRQFSVRGSWPFPIDMLRYDACWPADETASGALEALTRDKDAVGVIEIELKSNSPSAPTRRRWQAHMWHVV